MKQHETPIKLFFRTMHDACGCNMVDICRVLLPNKAVEVQTRERTSTVNPSSLLRYTKNRAPLTNTVSNSLPGYLPPEFFGNFEALPQLYVDIAASRAKRKDVTVERAHQEIFELLSGSSSLDMIRALERYDCNADPYDNLRDGIVAAKGLSASARAELMFLLFAISGCVGDPMLAAEKTARHALGAYRVNLLRELDPVTAPRPLLDARRSYSLQRVMGSNARGRAHELDPKGTLIGTFPQLDEGEEWSWIADVDNSVSDRHLLIWCSDGKWLARGCGSEHGTYILRGAKNARITIESPLLDPNPVDETVELQLGDCLVLGSTMLEFQLMTWGE